MQKVIQKLQRSVSQFREKGINIMEKIKTYGLDLQRSIRAHQNGFVKVVYLLL
jgi:4-hydroxyphenylpyruvate dioxygenase-like putative hemolysin